MRHFAGEDVAGGILAGYDPKRQTMGYLLVKASRDSSEGHHVHPLRLVPCATHLRDEEGAGAKWPAMEWRYTGVLTDQFWPDISPTNIPGGHASLPISLLRRDGRREQRLIENHRDRSRVGCEPAEGVHLLTRSKSGERALDRSIRTADSAMSRLAAETDVAPYCYITEIFLCGITPTNAESKPEDR